MRERGRRQQMERRVVEKSTLWRALADGARCHHIPERQAIDIWPVSFNLGSLGWCMFQMN
jgi:hypothetical protein